MAGQLTIDTLKASSGVLATQNGMTGIAKAWVNYNGTSGSTAIRSSFNVSSVTYSGTGYYTINFSTAMADANYSVVGSCRPTSTGFATATLVLNRNGSAGNTTPTASAFSVATAVQGSNNGTDSDYVCIAVFA